nr:efflux RND transporter periplasmic adaptor subunit [Paenalcaligenes hominis]
MLAIRKAITEGKLKADDQGQAPVKAIFDDRSEYAEQGKLLFSGVAVDPSTGQLTMRALFPNPNHDLLPGMFVRVRLEQAISENALLVPTQAVQYSTSGATSLMIVEEGVVKSVPVKLGSQIDGRIMVTEGLEPGATVIVAGFQKIRPGAPVQPMPWQDGASSETPAASSTADNG